MGVATPIALKKNKVSAKICCVIRIRGIVQGVGFRPTVWRYARAHGLNGHVKNDSCGVLIHCEGKESQVRKLIDKIRLKPPPNARITDIDYWYLPMPKELSSNFEIAETDGVGPRNTQIGPDIATCQDCVRDIFDPSSRRFGYAFTNCTNCGPRFSIVQKIPYDRAQTSMSAFKMCLSCHNEYINPLDRRFHAQPNACGDCGPQLEWLNKHGDSLVASDVINSAKHALLSGNIVAIKGLGGFQLACDATRPDIVSLLRRRKQRPDKPFALMAPDMAVIRQYCQVDDEEEKALRSSAAPIVLLRRLDNMPELAGIAPSQNKLGFMLPNTPLHHLLFANLQIPLVMTSGNYAGQPQCIDNDDAVASLSDIADYFLTHDRDIVQRVDDSVVCAINDGLMILRRARGYAPASLSLPPGFKLPGPILAVGGDLKNTFCYLSETGAMLSQHIGDLSDVRTINEMERTLSLYLQHDNKPLVGVAVDKHPLYTSRQLGKELSSSKSETSKLIEVQHHHAHFAACLADNQRPLNAEPVIGIVLDGVGYAGPDDTKKDGELWGGEILLGDYSHVKRLGCLKPTALPGGDKAMREPYRNTVAQLHSCFGWDWIERQYGDCKPIKKLKEQNIEPLLQMIDHKKNAPMSSSTGRLFDAVAAILGICSRGGMSFEGQAAMSLEALIEELDWKSGDSYPVDYEYWDNLWYLNLTPMWMSLLKDLRSDKSHSYIAAKFHRGLANGFSELVTKLATEYDVDTIALSGGVMQNLHLRCAIEKYLVDKGLHVLVHSATPANDGGISLGQALVAAARIQQIEPGKMLCV